MKINKRLPDRGILIRVGAAVVVGFFILNWLFPILKLDTLPFVGTLKQLFRIKRLASIEFTAKQAFQNFDMAMILLQLFVLLLIAVIIVLGVLGLRKIRYDRNSKKLLNSLNQLAFEVTLTKQRAKFSEKEKALLDKARKSSIDYIKQVLKGSYYYEAVGKEYYTVIIATLKILDEQSVPYEDQLQLVARLRDLLSAL